MNPHLELLNSTNLLIDLHWYDMVMDIVVKGQKVFDQSCYMDPEDVRAHLSVDLEVGGAAGLVGFDHQSRDFSIISLALSENNGASSLVFRSLPRGVQGVLQVRHGHESSEDEVRWND